jgi:hypothetical protein
VCYRADWVTAAPEPSAHCLASGDAHDLHKYRRPENNRAPHKQQIAGIKQGRSSLGFAQAVMSRQGRSDTHVSLERQRAATSFRTPDRQPAKSSRCAAVSAPGGASIRSRPLATTSTAPAASNSSSSRSASARALTAIPPRCPRCRRVHQQMHLLQQWGRAR